jgi:hypothetical protein
MQGLNGFCFRLRGGEACPGIGDIDPRHSRLEGLPPHKGHNIARDSLRDVLRRSLHQIWAL